MKILMYAGIAPHENPTIEDILTKKYDVGGNIGNLLFINAVGESINPNQDNTVWITHYRAEFSDSEIDKINQLCDFFILPLADAFREDNILQLKRLTVFIKKLKIPCVVIGVGLRAAYDSNVKEEHPFDNAVKDFVKAVLEKSECLGLRGERTGHYLKRLGFLEEKHFTPIGCPSMCMAAAGNGIHIRDVALSTKSVIALNGNDLAPNNVATIFRETIIKYPETYIVQQRESEMADVYLGKYSDYKGHTFRVEGSLYGPELYNKLLTANRIACFSNIYRWSEFLSKMDLCLNSRFHGTVVSLMSGTPSLIIPIDSRMQEMVEYHAIPNVPAKDIGEGDHIEGLLARIDVHKPEKIAKRNLEHYFNFLERNKIKHVDENYVLSYKFIAGDAYWKQSEEAFLELPVRLKAGRVSKYYAKKYFNRFLHKVSR